jgi:TonB family protein
MKARASLLVAMLAVGSAVALGQTSATPNDNAQAQDTANNAPSGSKDSPVRVSSGVIRGLILHKVDPVYPQDAKDAGVSGAVVMAAVIDDQGKIAKLSVVSGPEKLRDAALEAANQWTYKPFRLNGRPVFVQTTITMNFDLAK